MTFLGLGLIVDKVVGEIRVRAKCEFGLFSNGRSLNLCFFLFSSNNLIDGIGEFLVILILVKGDILFVMDL